MAIDEGGFQNEQARADRRHLDLILPPSSDRVPIV